MPSARTLLASLLLLILTANSGQGQPPAVDSQGDPLPKGAVLRLGTVRFRHNSPIVFTAFLPGGKSVLSVSDDGMVCTWELPSGKPLGRYESLAEPMTLVTSATLAPDGKLLTVFCEDGFLRVLDWANAKEIGKVAIKGAMIDKYGSMMYRSYGRMDPAVPVHSPDGKILMFPTAGGRLLQLVDLPQAKEIGSGPGHTAGLTDLWVAPDGKTILTRDGLTAHTWDSASGKILETVAYKQSLGLAGLTVYSPDGRFGVTAPRLTFPGKAAAAKPREAVLFEAATGKKLAKLEVEAEAPPAAGLAALMLALKAVVFSPDGNLLAIHGGEGQHKIDLYEVPSGKRLRTLDAGPVAAPVKGGGGKKGGGIVSTASKMLFSADGKAVAFQAGGGEPIHVLDVATGKHLGYLQAMENSVALNGAFTPDQRCLALEWTGGKVALCELATGQPRRTFGEVLPLAANKFDPLEEAFFGGMGGYLPTAKSRVNLALSPDGKLLALSGLGGAVHVWDVLTGKELRVFKGHTAPVQALAFAANGKTLVSASYDTTALVWDVTGITCPAAPGTPADFDKAWQALAEDDAALAFAVMGDSVAAPEKAVVWLKERVKPAPAFDPKRTKELIAQLESFKFNLRDQAYAELLRIGEPALELVDKALVGNLSPESRKRLEQLCEVLRGTTLQRERLRVFRAVEVLELIGTAQARQVVQALADGAPGALVTTSAQTALKRFPAK